MKTVILTYGVAKSNNGNNGRQFLERLFFFPKEEELSSQQARWGPSHGPGPWKISCEPETSSKSMQEDMKP